MGNVSSRIGEGDGLYLRDQNRFSVASLTIVNSRNRTLLNITPNSFPASRYTAKRDLNDETVVEYVQDPESVASSGPPTFLLRLTNDDELTFKFTFILRQGPAPPSIYTAAGMTTAATPTTLVDANINGLTFVFASTTKEVENLVTREFHADPNLHKNPNVYLVGDYSTGGSPSVQFTWSWKWKPPKNTEDRGGGWRNSCSFVEYDQRAHRLDTLASFSFWVHNVTRPLTSPKSPSPRIELGVPPRLRVPSAQSIESRVSDSDGNEFKDVREPQSPTIEPIPEDGSPLMPVETGSTAVTANTEATKVNIDISCQRPGEDLSQVDDGPLFRATMKSLEQKTGNMRTRWKRVLRSAEAAREAHIASNNAFQELMDSLRGASTSNANAVQPAIDHYFDKIAKEILVYEKLNTHHIQKLIIDPISKLYNVDIKQAEAKKEEFERESKDYYQYVGRYLGQRQDSLKEKKRVETDSKYQAKRRNFELKRFDYSSFMQDLHGGRKDQEILSSLTRFADAQARGYLETAKKIEAMVPQLEALSSEVKEVDKEFQLQRTEREEKRRALEKSTKPYKEPDGTGAGLGSTAPSTANGGQAVTNGSGLPQRTSSLLGGGYKTVASPPTDGSSPPSAKAQSGAAASQAVQAAHAAAAAVSSPGSSKFKGIRDLEDKDPAASGAADATLVQQHRKEGLLWALSRPGSHVDPKGFNKQAWHKFWIVLDQGKLSEYENWKDKPDLHMDPIDLRMASVREARGAERRFCFEVITPQFTRVYQATSEDDMRSWISAVNNALQSAVEGKGLPDTKPTTESLPGSTRRDIASVLTGKSTSVGHRSSYQSSSTKQPVSRHATVGDRPSYRTPEVKDEDSDKLLRRIREADAGNKQCADCGSESKVEWVSINLGIVVCIDCSGIHRSLGTHISKIRSLTLDTNSFTPDVLEILLTIGNRVSNLVWEAKLTDRTLKPGPFSTREQRFHFITAKYKDRAFVQPLSPTLSQYATPEDTLLASIKKNDIQNVLYAIAMGANLNATDRSRNTPALFLALSAADPPPPSAHSSPVASPGPTHTPNPMASIAQQPTPQTRKPFAVAELLLQNGADLPATQSPFPLGPSAKLFLEQKADRQKSVVTAAAGGAQGVGAGENVTALPPMVGMAGNGALGQPGTAGGLMVQREKEAKLQKRVSAGGRLMKHVEAELKRG